MRAVNLRDQLKKANLISDKEAKRLAHEERVKRKTTGREEAEQEVEARQAELQAKRDADRERDRQRQQELEADRKLREERAACEALLASESRAPERGSASWHFELPDGRLPMLRLSEADRHQLLAGRLCVVRPREDESVLVFRLLATEHAKRVRRQMPERIVWAASGTLPA